MYLELCTFTDSCDKEDDTTSVTTASGKDLAPNVTTAMFVPITGRPWALKLYWLSQGRHDGIRKTELFGQGGSSNEYGLVVGRDVMPVLCEESVLGLLCWVVRCCSVEKTDSLQIQESFWSTEKDEAQIKKLCDWWWTTRGNANQ